jgi:acyl carrier protein
MTIDEATALVLRCLADIAPDVDTSSLSGDTDLRRAADLDSMDVFNLVAAITERSGVDIPDTEVAGLTTVAAFADRIT